MAVVSCEFQARHRGNSPPVVIRQLPFLFPFFSDPTWKLNQGTHPRVTSGVEKWALKVKEREGGKWGGASRTVFTELGEGEV